VLSAAVFLTIQIALSIGAALSAGTSPIRRILMSVFLLAALAFPLQARDPLAKVCLTLLALMALVKCVFIVNAKPEWQTPVRRIWQVLVPFDIRRTSAVRHGLEWKSLARIAAAMGIVALAIWFAITKMSALSDTSLWLAKWACMLVAAYSLMELSGELLRSVHRLGGIAVEQLQRNPIVSRSVAEFWGERWNLPMTRWLNDFFFRPLARRGHPLAGIVAAFIVSAALHAWLFFAATGWKGALLAGAFFLVQIPAVLLERHWHVRRWPAFAAHLWTLGFLVLSSPLFLWPMIRGVEAQLSLR
jgi:hypothetical protein